MLISNHKNILALLDSTLVRPWPRLISVFSTGDLAILHRVAYRSTARQLCLMELALGTPEAGVADRHPFCNLCAVNLFCQGQYQLCALGTFVDFVDDAVPYDLGARHSTSPDPNESLNLQ
jgi:hypothetical protein